MRPPQRGRGGGGFRGGRGDGGRGRGRGGGGGRGGGSKVVVEPHRHEGVFIAKGKEDAVVTKNMVPGEAVYNEKRISVQNEDGSKVEYRVWNPFWSKLAAAILGGVDEIWIKPGARVLYLGAASGTTVSHVSDIVGPARILALNASYFLKAGGHFVISIKSVFAQEVKKLQAEQFRPSKQVTLEPFERDHACVVGGYRMPSKKQKPAA
ncbi:hypothetical protein CRG98_027497 [Punica granatum]|uniref:Mediator of RNA polymerase II transcription subunit 36b n=1 Tax=Punica granatum TaxID=22663 RepID=A0A2I0J760_PUNGR|nr:hypothetical protein CRG98_027497 [Punica granatum]